MKKLKMKCYVIEYDGFYATEEDDVWIKDFRKAKVFSEYQIDALDFNTLFELGEVIPVEDSDGYREIKLLSLPKLINTAKLKDNTKPDAFDDSSIDERGK
jgi:hypothetical protein